MDKFELLGFVDAGGQYHRTPLRDAVEHGGVFLWDELDSSFAQPLTAFNAALDNHIITFPDNKTFTIDPNKTLFIAAGNTVGNGANRKYIGRNQLDGATLNRFMQLDVGYDEAIECAMATSAWLSCGGDSERTDIAQDWCQVVQSFRKLLEDRSIAALITTRATRRGAKLLAKGFDVEKVKTIELYKHLSTDQLKQLGV